MGPPEGKTSDNMQMYVDLVCQEIRATQRLNDSGPLQTVFFGGGKALIAARPLLNSCNLGVYVPFASCRVCCWLPAAK